MASTLLLLGGASGSGSASGGQSSGKGGAKASPLRDPMENPIGSAERLAARRLAGSTMCSSGGVMATGSLLPPAGQPSSTSPGIGREDIGGGVLSTKVMRASPSHRQAVYSVPWTKAGKDMRPGLPQTRAADGLGVVGKATTGSRTSQPSSHAGGFGVIGKAVTTGSKTSLLSSYRPGKLLAESACLNGPPRDIPEAPSTYFPVLLGNTTPKPWYQSGSAECVPLAPSCVDPADAKFPWRVSRKPLVDPPSTPAPPIEMDIPDTVSPPPPGVATVPWNWPTLSTVAQAEYADLPVAIGSIGGAGKAAGTSEGVSAAAAVANVELDTDGTTWPSVGSKGHEDGTCKPCAFHMKAGVACRNGAECTFCHICEAGEKKRRKKERRAVRTAERAWRRSQAKAG